MSNEPIIKKIPNILSTSRFVMALGIPFAFPINIFVPPIYYAIGNGTDALDGYIARHFNASSRYGKLMDPIADKSFNFMSIAYLLSTSFNPLLIALFASELYIASISTIHVIHNMKKLKSHDKTKTNKLTLKNFNIKDVGNRIENNLYDFFEISDQLIVSRVGRKKAVVMFITMILAFLTPIYPSLSGIVLGFISGTLLVEIPVMLKYTLEYHKEVGILKDNGNKMLDKLNKLDTWVDSISKIFKKKDKKYALDISDTKDYCPHTNIDNEEDITKKKI